MSIRKYKSKTVKQSKINHISIKQRANNSHPINKYPRIFLSLGASLIVTGVYLIMMGIHSHAKLGLAILSIFFGTVIVLFANSALPKKRIKSIK